MPRILHVATDEKFINAANFIFETAFKDSNQFVIVQPQANPAIKYIEQRNNVEVVVQGSSTIHDLLNKSTSFQLIVFHGFDAFKAQLFLRATDKHKYLWLLWGAEVYNETILNSSFLGSKTQVLNDGLSALSWKQKLIETCKYFYRTIVYRSIADIKNVSIKEAIYNMPGMGILYKEEYDFFRQSGVFKPATSFIPFTYYPIEFIFKDESLSISGDNILLGNSASPTNNHLEAIDMLAKLNIKHRQVCIPLSYGSAAYANSVIEYAKKVIPDNHKPITGFLPLQEYNLLLANCGIVIMNHYRQQAVGNVLAALFLGAKVFLNNTTLYHFLKRIGCIIFLIEDTLLHPQADTFTILTKLQIEHNRNILRKHIGIDNVVYHLKNALNEYYKIAK
jgi:dTDP-N-acetylfucosamine:lipid II N-acetylfucosaminyltransferase